MNKKTIFYLLTCILLVASTTYIICNKREQVPPILVWDEQEYYVANEPAKVEEVGQKLGEVTKKIKTSKKPTKNRESNTLQEKTEVFIMIEEEKSDYPPLIIKEAYSDEYRVVRPMLKQVLWWKGDSYADSNFVSVVVKKNICLFPPIGAAYILMNRGAIQKRDYILYLLFATMNISLWLSLMIFDRSMWMVAGHYIIGAIVIVFSNINKR